VVVPSRRISIPAGFRPCVAMHCPSRQKEQQATSARSASAGRGSGHLTARWAGGGRGGAGTPSSTPATAGRRARRARPGQLMPGRAAGPREVRCRSCPAA
jgi:hypothetical protein